MKHIDLRQHPNFKMLIKNRKLILSSDPFVVISSNLTRSSSFFSRSVFGYHSANGGQVVIETHAGDIKVSEKDFP